MTNADEVPEARHEFDPRTFCCQRCGETLVALMHADTRVCSRRLEIREGSDPDPAHIAEATEAARGDH